MVHSLNDFIIIHGNVFVGSRLELFGDSAIWISKGKVREISRNSKEMEKYAKANSIPFFDAHGAFIGPGLIDMHIHGCGGHDTGEIDKKAALEDMAKFLCERGITSFQPAVVPDVETMSEVCDAWHDSEILQYHVVSVYNEGPFIAMEKKGGLPEESIKEFSPAYMEKLLSFKISGLKYGAIVDKPMLGTMTMAPELEGADVGREMLESSGVKVAWGHSCAYADEIPGLGEDLFSGVVSTRLTSTLGLGVSDNLADRISDKIVNHIDRATEHFEKKVQELHPGMGNFFDDDEDDYNENDDGHIKGAHFTHLFNAMNGIDHKRPGLALVPFLEKYKDSTCELIGDTVHVKPLTMKFIFDNIGTDRVCLISDSMSAGGTGPGESVYLGRKVICDGMCSRYKETGTLIGSAMLINETSRHLFEMGLIELDDIFRIASVNPAKVLKLEDRGKIAIGCRGDLVVLDKNLHVKEVFISRI